MLSKIFRFRFNNILTLKKFLSDEKPLGRWKRESYYKTDLKTDWANEDHCGVCSGYLENALKNVEKNNLTSENSNDKIEISTNSNLIKKDIISNNFKIN